MIERYLEYNNNCSKVIKSSRAWNADPIEHFGYRSIFKWEIPYQFGGKIKLSHTNRAGRKIKCCIWKDKLGGYAYLTNSIRRSLVYK